MYAADHIKETRTYRFIHSSLQGWHTAPQAMLDDYNELEQLIDDGQETRNWGKREWANKKLEQQAEDVAVRLTRLFGYGDLVTEHLQPALDNLVRQFRQDREAAGRYAMQEAVHLDMLDQPDDVRAAIVRLFGILQPYGALRTTWADFRGTPDDENNGNYGPPAGDPFGVRSPLAEVRNIDQLVPNWKTAGQHGGTSWPWPSEAMHVRLGWILDHDGQIWLPTKREQDTVWNQLHQQPQRTAA